MTWHKYGYCVGGIGRRHSSHCIRITDFLCQFLVGCGVSVWDIQEFVPHPALKFGSAEEEGNVKRRALSGEIFIQLDYGAVNHVGSPLHEIGIEITAYPSIYAGAACRDIPIAEAEFSVIRAEKHISGRGMIYGCNYSVHDMQRFSNLQKITC